MIETSAVSQDDLSINEPRMPERPVDEARRQNDLLEKMFIVRALPQYLKYLDDIAREIRAANETKESRERRAILNLIEYLDWLDYFHGTREKQELIQHLGNNPKFMLFKTTLHELEATLARLKLSFLVDRDFQLDRLNNNLERFEGYKLVVLARSGSSR